jgi:hypothetical protein
MNPFSNIWKHPRTSAAGILISVATVAGVLGQSGVGLGKVGSGTVVSLAGAVATALLGLLSRDPAPQPVPVTTCSGNCSKSGSTTSQFSVWLLIALLLPLPWLEGCTASSVAKDIVNWTPSLQSAVATVDSTAAVLAPADATIFAAATAGFDAASNVLAAQARSYLANPSATTLAQLQSQIVTLQQQVNTALLSSVRIVDSASQQHAMAAIQGVATIVNAILSLVQSVSSKAALAQMASASTIKLAAVAPYIDQAQSAQLIAAHYNEPVSAARVQIAQSEALAIHAGF